jgi:hypothetical protein
MMGDQPIQSGEFYALSFGRFVLQTHLVRKLDSLLNLDLVRKRLAKHDSPTGRPSIDPE